MKITISRKQMELTDGIKDTINEKLGRLDFYLHEETEVRVTVRAKKSRQTIEVTIIPISGPIIRAEDSEENLYAAIDVVYDKLNKQLRKYKNKLQDKHKKNDSISPALFFKSKEYLFLLFASYKELLKGMLIKLPLSHIIVESLDADVLIFQNLIKIAGSEQLLSLCRISEGQLFKVLKTLYLAVACHDKRLLNDGCKGNVKFAAVADNGEFSMLHMPRHKPSSVICIIYIYRIAVESFFGALNAVRGRIDQSPYRSLSLILKRKASFIFLSFSDPHHNMGFGKDNFRLRDMEIPFCKTFDLIFQIRHLLIILVPAGRQKDATMNYIIIVQYMAMGEYNNLFPDCIHVCLDSFCPPQTAQHRIYFIISLCPLLILTSADSTNLL